jgi:hypothetical protein
MNKWVTPLFVILCFFLVCRSFAQQWGEYTLYAKQNSTTAYLIDTNNNVYHSWSFSSNAKTGYSTYLLPGGTILRTIARQGNQLNGPAMCGQFQKVDWNGTVDWDFVYSTSTYCSHHDICPMPNGNVLLICYEVKTPAQAIQAGCSQSITIWPEKIVEVQQTGTNTGTIVWEWHIWDHLCQNHDATKDNYVTSIVMHPELLNINYQTQKDWIHANGIDYNPLLDQIVFSSHNLNEIYVIDHSTTTGEAASHSGGNSGQGGDFLYRWGNPQVYQAGNASNKIFNVVHDAHWVPGNCPGAGMLVGFNNNGISNNQSSVDYVSPPYDGYNYSITPGSAFLPPTYTSRLGCNGHTNNMGNSQQLPNGNTLVCVTQSGLIYEVDPSGTMIWSKNVSGGSPMAFRYSACYVSGSTLTVEALASDDDICPGTEIQLNAIATGGSNYSYSWTSSPPGFTSTLQNPVVTPDETTTYTVTVTSEGCVATSSVEVIVFAVPNTPTIFESGDTLFSSLASGYQWFFEGILIEGAVSQFYIPEENGGYQVQVEDENGCLSDMSEIYYFINSWILDITGNESLVLIPNPVKTTFWLKGEMLKKEFEVWITDSMGRLILHAKNQTGFDFSKREDGIYHLFINDANGKIFSRKIVFIR